MERLAQLLFNARALVLGLFALVTLFMGYQAAQIQVNSDISKLVPLSHPYIQNFFKHRDDLDLGNDVRIIIADVRNDDIFNEQYLDVLRMVTDEVYTMPGVDPSNISSLWTPNVRWNEVTEEGFQGGEITPQEYDGSEDSLEQVRTNVLRSGYVGRLVSDDFRSSIVQVGLLDVLSKDSEVDIPTLAATLEDIRERYESQYPFVRIHIVGGAKKIGEVIAAAEEVAMFFFVTLFLTLVLLFLDTRCYKSSFVVVGCSCIAVIWQLGLVSTLGFTIDPYSMLVPFLVFAIAVSHGVQIVNSFLLNRVEGQGNKVAAQSTFLTLVKPGIVALISDGIGFITLYLIDVGVIRELAIAASVGVAVVIITNLIIVPLLLSFSGVADSARQRAEAKEKGSHPLVALFSRFTHKPFALASIVIAALAYGGGIYVSQDLKIGDLDKGAPELWPDPCLEQNCERGYKPDDRYRYNHDVNFLVSNYSVSADVLVVMAETQPQLCNESQTLQLIDRFSWELLKTPGVQDVISMSSVTKLVTANMNEGSPKWASISRDQMVLNSASRYMPQGFMNLDCDLVPIFVFLNDHKAETLETVTSAVQQFNGSIDNSIVNFLLASGNAGIEAATNQTIAASQGPMLALVYGVVIVLCWLAFRSIRAVICIIVPLGLTSVLCQALMAQMGIGVKVATLPVIALGVGIGVDYGIYIYSKLSSYLQQGMSLDEAYQMTLRTTGKAVAFTGLALAVGVFFWVFSSIKFQADMGILLTFMFLWNMIGALWLLPSMARFLLKEAK